MHRLNRNAEKRAECKTCKVFEEGCRLSKGGLASSFVGRKEGGRLGGQLFVELELRLCKLGTRMMTPGPHNVIVCT